MVLSDAVLSRVFYYMEKYGYIYKITSPTGRVYIGQTVNVKNRLRTYTTENCKSQPILYRSLKKYTWEKHEFEVIERCLFNDINIRERYWQDYYRVLDRGMGLNCVLTRTDQKPMILSEETKRKRTKNTKGIYTDVLKRNNENWTPERREKIRQSRIGVVPWNKGIPRTKEDRKTMSIARKGKHSGLDHSGLTILLNTETGIFYFGDKEASDSFSHITLGCLKHMMKGTMKQKTMMVKLGRYKDIEY